MDTAPEEPHFNGETHLGEIRIGVAGLGLMGGSLALGLRGKCAKLLGADPDPETRAQAVRAGVVERAAPHLEEIVSEVDLLILAAPVRAIIQMILRLPALTQNRLVVMDVGSTKTDIAQAMESLPPNFDPVPAHPMCGKEVRGLAHADPELYRNAVFAITPLPRTSKNALSLVEELILTVGAHPLQIAPAAHDRWVAGTSHLPYLLAAALTLATPQEAARLIGPGFQSAARLAGSDPGMMLDILLTNRAQILERLGAFRTTLGTFEAALEQKDDNLLYDLMSDARLHREKLLDRKHLV